MTEFELDKLKDLPTPKPSARAKRAALVAARLAFDAQQSRTQEKEAKEIETNEIANHLQSSADLNTTTKNPATSKTPVTAKGITAPARQTHITSNPPRRKLMRLTPTTYAIAASLLVTALFVPPAIHYATKRNGVLGQIPLLRPTEGASYKPDRNAAPPPIVARPKPILDALQSNESRSPVTATNPKRKAEHFASRTPKLAAELRKKWRSNDLAASKVPTLRIDNDGTTARQVASVPESSKPTAPAKFALQRLHNKLKSYPGGAAVGGDMLAHRNQQAYLRGRIAGLTTQSDRRVAPPRYVGRDKFEAVKANTIKSVKVEPVSTFSVDVDTASYSFVRRALNAGRLPQKHAVRVEELINYFAYDYATPESRMVPFKPTVTVLPSPWNPQNQLVHIGIKGYALNASERPRANLVFLIDVSGSMQGSDRLPLLKNAFRMLVDSLKPDDSIGIVTYASGSGVALKSTKVAQKAKILAAIDRLGAGGSTAGARGIRDAYQLARANFDKSAVNRIILATDGDFNVGISNREELKSYIERQRKTGIFLSILGVGRGNYNDALMQTLAQNGNGTAAYIDTLNEARKVLVEEAASTLFPIAKDVKIQIEFNPARVKSYRLIGYETRALKREDFNNDKVDAGEVGSGHRVTAIYEITPVGVANKLVDSLRYGKPAGEPAAAVVDPDAEFGFLKLRYKLPKETKSRLISLPITKAFMRASPDAAPADVRFSTAVAAFAQLLRGGAHLGSYSFDDVIALANGAKGADPFGIRAQFVNLVRLAKTARP